MRPPTPIRSPLAAALLATALCALASPSAHAQIDIPTTDDQGGPIDVGLLVLGHSTSISGDWPGKLQDVLNADATDGRNYVVFRNIAGGDGGFLWANLSLAPSRAEYDRILASSPEQLCEDDTGIRWSCRRLLVERSLGGTDPAPSCCATSQPPAVASCVWHENGQSFEEPFTDFLTCWQRMDVRLALVQDTTNRSWPVDDSTGDGQVGADDYFPADAVHAEALPCGGTSGVVDGFVDWNCDGLLDLRDTADLLYSRWLESLADDLVTGFGANGVDHVLFSIKPVELGHCDDYPYDPCCSGGSCDLRHTVRSPTPSRPFARFYLPSVYWEHRSLDLLAGRQAADSPIHLATPWSTRYLWDRSAQCYEEGIPAADWTLPSGAGQPPLVVADDLETDGVDDDTVGCLLADHVHQTDDGGWMMADSWYAALRYHLTSSIFTDGFESGDVSAWSTP